jgi:hypothetical protein
MHTSKLEGDREIQKLFADVPDNVKNQYLQPVLNLNKNIIVLQNQKACCPSFQWRMEPQLKKQLARLAEIKRVICERSERRDDTLS